MRHPSVFTMRSNNIINTMEALKKMYSTAFKHDSLGRNDTTDTTSSRAVKPANIDTTMALVL